MKSIHGYKNVLMTVYTTMGLASGSTTRRNTTHSFAPSSQAASRSVLGTVSKYPLAIRYSSAAGPDYTMLSPTRLFVSPA